MFKPSRGPVGECIVCTFIAACVPPPTDNTYEVMGFLNLFLVLAHIPQPSQSIRFGILQKMKTNLPADPSILNYLKIGITFTN